MYKWEAMMDNIETNKVEEEYNYKRVDYKWSKTSYLFSTKDLVKELKEDNYKSVTISLMAEFEDNERIPLASSAYLSLQNKEWVLNNLLNKQEEDSFYNYNSDDIEQYLEKLAESMTRSNYKKMINNAWTKLTKMIKTTSNKKELLITSIKKESNFENKLNEYKALKDTSVLLNNLNRAVKSQIYNIRTFDVIDSILK